MKKTAILIILVLVIGSADVLAQEFDQVEIKVEKITESIYMLVGRGGNIGVCVGDDGTLIVDDQYAPLMEKIVSAIASFTDKPVNFVINTHWHFDHTDGNENFGGEGAIIVSHENSRRRMEADQLVELFGRRQKAYSCAGLPKITFDESIRFHLNGKTIDVLYLGRAHTDGDAIVYFRNSNVIHTGDLFVRYGLPFIDQPNGGSINGIIDVVSRIAEMTDDETVFIPGHGALSDRNDLIDYRDMLVTIRDRVLALVQQGRSFEYIKEANPTEGYRATAVSAENFLRLVYDSLMDEN